MIIYFENFPEEDEDGNGMGVSSYAEVIGELNFDPDIEMWDALKQWAKRNGFTDVTSGDPDGGVPSLSERLDEYFRSEQ